MSLFIQSYCMLNGIEITEEDEFIIEHDTPEEEEWEVEWPEEYWEDDFKDED